MAARHPDEIRRAHAKASLPERLQTFWSWMAHHRGLMASTLDDYCSNVAKLIDVLGLDPASYSAHGIRKFILARAAHHSASHAQNVAAAVRAYLKFLAATGQIVPELIGAVPRIAGWRLATLPRHVSAADVNRIIGSCDLRRRIGRRDRAILLLLSRLGLRAGDVAGLRLSDIDWSRGEILVTGKGRRPARLPLPQETGDAILGYLRRGRAVTEDNRVFIRSRRPWRALSSCAISDIVDRAIRRAGVEAPFHGAHLLRHSLATSMLREGIPLQAIAGVLRHRSIETTAIYAKVDLDLLREVAQPWPEVTP